MTAASVALRDRIIVGDSEMASRMRAYDWAGSALGPVEQWPENLRAAVRLCLTSGFPICLWWGRDLAMLYNDAFLPWLGEAKHPRALMQAGRDVWLEVWDIIGPMLDGVVVTARATYSEDTQLFYDRKLPKEEVYITWSYSPILAADGRTVDGVFCPCSENTEKVIGARRLETLRKLGTRPADARTASAACKESVAALASNPYDVPFAAIYVVDADENAATLCAATASVDHLLPRTVSMSAADSGSPWPLVEALRTKSTVDCTTLTQNGIRIRSGPWPESVEHALVVPIKGATDYQLAGLLVAGVSSRRPLDADYRTFFALVAGHIGAAIADAQAYEAEHKRADALAEIDRAKSVFFSNVSHEFRTPLTLMLGPLTDMLSRADVSVTIERGELELVHRSSLRLLKLVNTLLDFSRIEAGRMQATYEALDLSQLTAELASVFRAAIERAGLTLIVDCPPLDEPVYVDRNMWEKIVLNLISNAFKFTFEGEIKVTLRAVGEHVELEIADTGTGIPEHELPRVFERFHRIEGARARSFEGTGIGLAFVQELAKLHGAAVRAASVYGQGSRFTVSIPLGKAHLPASQLEPTQPSGAAGANAYIEEALRWLPDEPDRTASRTTDAPPVTDTRARILVADDNADLRQYVQRLLSPIYEVQLAADGEGALAAAREHPPDLVVADVMMPQLDGFGLLAALRSDPRTHRVPVIMLSARAGEEARVVALTAGASDYVVKPFSARELLARVSTTLAAARASRTAVEREKSMRRSAENAEARTKEELAAELAAMNRLHELSTRLLSETPLEPLLGDVLDASIALLSADFGNIQLCDTETGVLTIVAQRGFTPEFLHYFDAVDNGTGSCRMALERKQRVIVEDVLTEPAFQPHLKIVAAAGYRAVQSTRLLGSGGHLLGVISTHFREPYRLSDHELRFMDLYASQTVELIERKRAEAALRASEERFRRYFELGLIGMALTSPTKGILEVNDHLCRILGYECEELLRKTWAEMTHPDDLAADAAQFQRILDGEIDGYSIDKRWIRKDGTVIYSIMAARCGRRPDGSVDYLVGLVQDITERKLASEALTEAQAQLAWMMRVTTMGELAASIAHEVNQPLAAIVANGNAGARWLAASPPNLAEVNTALERIVRDANRAGDIINRIRAFLKRQAPQRTPVNVSEVIADVLAMLQGQLRSTDVLVTHQQSALGLLVHADRVSVQQVMLNLVMNAIDAMRAVNDRARRATIEVARHGADMLCIAVRDCGVGIRAAERERIFDPFHTSKPDGMGMGLAISRSIVESHGGQLWVTPNEGPGVTFQFVLPLSPQSSLVTTQPSASD